MINIPDGFETACMNMEDTDEILCKLSEIEYDLQSIICRINYLENEDINKDAKNFLLSASSNIRNAHQTIKCNGLLNLIKKEGTKNEKRTGRIN